MAQTEWLHGADPLAMLFGLDWPVNARKLQLFTCAYCRAVWADITDPHLKALVELTEGIAELPDKTAELWAAWREVLTI